MSGSGKWLRARVSGISRARRVTAGLAILVISTSTIAVAVGDMPADEATFGAAPPASPGVAVHGVHDLAPHYQHAKDDAAKKATVTAVTWPTAAHTQVRVPRETTGKAPAVRAAGTPVTIRPAAVKDHGPSVPMTVEVRTADHASALRAGTTGVLVAVTPKTGSGAVQVSVDYSSFNQAYGGNFGSRLRLEQLPACALTTPSVA